MNHQEVRKHMGEYLQGDLTLRQRALFDGHLDACDDCARELRGLRQTVHWLRNLPPPPTPPGLAERVMERIEAGEGRRRLLDAPARWLRALDPARISAPLAGAAVAVAAALVVVGDDSFQVTISLPGQRDLAQEAAQAPDAPAPSALEERQAAAAGERQANASRERQAASAPRRPGVTGVSTHPQAPVTSPLRRSAEGPAFLLEVPFGMSAGDPGAPSGASRLPRILMTRTPAEDLKLALHNPSAFVARFHSLPPDEAQGWLEAVAAQAAEERAVERVSRGLRAIGGADGHELARRFERTALAIATTSDAR